MRAYYGLTLRELALCLGISETLAHHYETARRVPSRAVAERLAPFLDQVPPAAEAEAAPLPTAPPAGRLDPGPLHKRRATCLHEAANLRWQLRQLPAQARTAAHWARALPALLAAVPPPEAAPAADLAARREAIRRTYVRDLLDLQATALDPATLSQWHLLHLRAEALEAAAAALAALLGPGQE